jgi:hypothetical protein
MAKVQAKAVKNQPVNQKRTKIQVNRRLLRAVQTHNIKRH